MPKLVLKFEDTVLKELVLGSKPVTIGRGPDNDLHIDNLAVSTHHARVYVDAGRVIIEDLNSLNGTLLNNQRITKSYLTVGDKVLIGKHHVLLGESGAGEAPAAAGPKVVAPKIAETVMLDTKARKELLAQAAAQQAAQAPPRPGGTVVTQPGMPPRARAPTLVVVSGKTNQFEYRITGSLVAIGKSEMATVKLQGWFKPKLAAQINKKDDGYYIVKVEKTPSVNGLPITGPTKLSDGDIIEVAGVRMNFIMKD